MRRSLTIATGLATAGVMFLAIPVGAASNGSCDGSGRKAGTGQQAGPGMQGQRRGSGMQGMKGQRRGPTGQGMQNLPMGTLTDEQKAALAYMAEEEKLAHDVYTVLGKKYPKTVIFKRIATSEQRHWDVVGMLLDRYGIADPTDGTAPGVFASAELQTMYKDLLDSATTRTTALKVGVAIEEDDIAELQKAAEGVTAPDVSRVYSNLTRASEQHLSAFEARL